jgi:hypothetical protein
MDAYDAPAVAGLDHVKRGIDNAPSRGPSEPSD